MGDIEIPLSALQAWNSQTTAEFTVETFPGDHFFIHSAKFRVLNSVRQELQKRIAARTVSFAGS
jgi:medium-chain acyl-[acyl-carrier-protein] hydrolase